MNNFELPVCIPQVYGFLHHAHKLSILLQDETYLPWFYSNYLQLYTAEHSNEFKLDFYSFDGKYPRHPGINGNWFERELFLQLNQNLILFIKGCVDNGRYIEILVDEYYLSCKPAYKEWHFIHQSLIYGYDDDRECFQVLGFSRAGDYRKIEMSFNEVEEAFYNSSIAGVGFFECGVHLDYSNTNPDLNLTVIKTYLKDFLNSTNSFLTYTPSGASYGLKTYNILSERFKEEPSLGDDIRPIHIIFEHKKCMVNRLKYLQEQGNLAGASILLEGYTDLMQHSNTLKLMQLKYQFTRGQKLIDRIIEGLAGMANNEEELLETLLNSLDQYELKR